MGVVIVVFLSNAIPVLAKKIDIIEQLLKAMAKAAKSYSQGKILLSAYANSNSIVALSKGFDLLKASYLTALNTAQQWHQ
ncbi:hypothetical protein [Bartonella sp. MR100HLJHH]|uniref:hypothetical protein n=1 Tax=Bartonella sp. MR100HLJHH TaxID=3243554 RepID=UPI0035CF694E